MALGRAGRPAPASGSVLGPRPHRLLIGLETPGVAGDWAKSLPVAVKFSASLKGPAFPVLDGAYLKASLGKFRYKG